MGMFSYISKLLWHPSSLSQPVNNKPEEESRITTTIDVSIPPSKEKRKARRDIFDSKFYQARREEVMIKDDVYYLKNERRWLGPGEINDHKKYFLEWWEDVSEPVFAFVDTLKASPKRFKFKLEVVSPTVVSDNDYTVLYYRDTHIHDNYVKVYTKVHSRFGSYEFERDFMFITTDEFEYLTQEINKLYNQRKTTIEEYKKNKSRQKYMNIYCKVEG